MTTPPECFRMINTMLVAVHVRRSLQHQASSALVISLGTGAVFAAMINTTCEHVQQHSIYPGVENQHAPWNIRFPDWKRDDKISSLMFINSFFVYDPAVASIFAPFSHRLLVERNHDV